MSEDERESISPLRFIIRSLGKHRVRLVSAFFWSILFVLIPMQVPILLGALVDGLHGRAVTLYGIIHLSGSQEYVVESLSIALVIVAVLSGIAAYFRSVSVARVSRHFITELRKNLVQKLEALSLDIHSKYGPGELLNRAILDTQTLRPFVDSIVIKNSSNVVRLTYPLAAVFLLDPFLAALASPILVVQWLITRSLRRKLHGASRKARSSIANLTTVLKEHLDGIETIQTSNAEKTSFRQISRLAETVEQDQIRTQKYSGMLNGIVWLITNLGLALIFWQGGLQVIAGTLTVGTLIAFTGLWLFVYEPLRDFYKSINDYQKGIVAAERIQEIIELPLTVQESPNAAPLSVHYGGIEFENVRFSYPNTQRDALVDLDLSIEPGTLVAVVGRSGAGKSTILKLITRLYDPSAGRVLIDGQDIRGVTLDSLRSYIAVVPQIPLIFTGSVAENMRLAKPDATDEELIEACRSADALGFILKLPDGLNTRLGQGGANFSGGQIQRIAIARALIRKPRILLLDEPGSALDSESEAAIMATLQHLTGITIIIVGHHLKAMSTASRLIVLDNGKAIEDGAHEELLSSEGLYSSLYVKASV